MDHLTVLQWVVCYLISKPNENNEFAYEMFNYFLTIGADINKRNSSGNGINAYINQIKDESIKQSLRDKLLQFK